MKKLIICLVLLLAQSNVISQTLRIAILDFENISGLVKYDGLGKAMSSMLISDIESNVSTKRLQLVERAQIQKILKEQNFQSSINVNKNTTVQTGKILGVKFLLLGDIYVLNDQLIINARLANTETGDIVFSKKQEGKLVNWLSLKTGIAQDLSTKLNLPITSKSLNSDKISENSLLLYANGINYLDKNEIDSANKILTELKYTEKNFNYTDAQMEKLFENATKQSSNNDLKQKAYILNLHKRISLNPSEAWQQIETFWNGPLDEKYPYLEYIFLRNVYEKFKNDSSWLNLPITRHGVSTKMGDMLLYSISQHASLSGEIKTAIYYNQIRENKFPLSEIATVYDVPIHPSKYRWQLIEDPNNDTIYYRYLLAAQEAYILGIGSRNYKIMRNHLLTLLDLLKYPFYDYIPSEYYYEIEEKKIPIFNPYDVLGTLVVLVGDEDEKIECQKFFAKNKEQLLYTGTIQTQAWYKNNIENSLLIKNSAPWAQSSFDDYRNKNWTDLDFSKNYIANLCIITIDAICLQTLNKDLLSYQSLEKLKSLIDNNPSINNQILWSGLTFQQIYLTVQFRNAIALGKIDDIKFLSRQLKLIGIDPYKYASMHTELFE